MRSGWSPKRSTLNFLEVNPLSLLEPASGFSLMKSFKVLFLDTAGIALISLMMDFASCSWSFRI